MYAYIGKSVSNHHLGFHTDSCCVQNHVIMNLVIKRLRCNSEHPWVPTCDFVENQLNYPFINTKYPGSSVYVLLGHDALYLVQWKNNSVPLLQQMPKYV